jgi:hypothetical protein
MREVVEAFGGTYKLAEWAGISPPGVSNWLADGEFPRGWHYRLHMEAIRRGFEIDPALFGERPDRLPPTDDRRSRGQNRSAA